MTPSQKAVAKYRAKFGDKYDYSEVERQLLVAFSDFYPKESTKYHGYTECFLANQPPITTFLATCQASS